MLSHSFHDSHGTAVAHSKTLTDASTEKGFTRCGSIKTHISGNMIFGGTSSEILERSERQRSAAKPFANIIIGLTLQSQNASRRQESTETLSSRSRESGKILTLPQAKSNTAILVGDLLRRNSRAECWCLERPQRLIFGRSAHRGLKLFHALRNQRQCNLNERLEVDALEKLPLRQEVCSSHNLLQRSKAQLS